MEKQLVPQLRSTRRYLNLKPFNGAGAEICIAAQVLGLTLIYSHRLFFTVKRCEASLFAV